MRYLKVFLQEILRIPIEEGESYNLTFSEEKLLAIVARIQAKIFDKTFSFNAAKIQGRVLRFCPLFKHF